VRAACRVPCAVCRAPRLPDELTRSELRRGCVRPLPASVVVNKTLEKSLFLKNTSEKAVAFKVKTTAPKRYCVRPNSSVIKAHESIEVRIVMQVRKAVACC